MQALFMLLIELGKHLLPDVIIEILLFKDIQERENIIKVYLAVFEI